MKSTSLVPQPCEATGIWPCCQSIAAVYLGFNHHPGLTFSSCSTLSLFWPVFCEFVVVCGCFCSVDVLFLLNQFESIDGSKVCWMTCWSLLWESKLAMKTLTCVLYRSSVRDRRPLSHSFLLPLALNRRFKPLGVDWLKIVNDCNSDLYIYIYMHMVYAKQDFRDVYS